MGKPYCSVSGQNLQQMLKAFQIERQRNSGLPYHWKMFRVKRILTISITDHKFNFVRPEYNHHEPIMMFIICKIKLSNFRLLTKFKIKSKWETLAITGCR